MAKRDRTNEEDDELEQTGAPQSLENIIERQRTRMLKAYTVLGCTQVAMNQDESALKDEHNYETMIQLARGMIHKAADQLDSHYLEAFYEELASVAKMRECKSTPRWDLTIEVMGTRWPLLAVETGVCSCGTVADGISLSHYRPSSPGDWDGGWVISFADLEAIYYSALAKRGRAPDHTGPIKSVEASTHSAS